MRNPLHTLLYSPFLQYVPWIDRFVCSPIRVRWPQPARVFFDAIPTFERQSQSVWLRRTDNDIRVLTNIKGTCGLPRIRQGDRVLVDCKNPPNPGELVSFEWEGQHWIKRFLRRDDKGRPVMFTENPPVENTFPADTKMIRIIGVIPPHAKDDA